MKKSSLILLSFFVFTSFLFPRSVFAQFNAPCVIFVKNENGDYAQDNIDGKIIVDFLSDTQYQIQNRGSFFFVDTNIGSYETKSSSGDNFYSISIDWRKLTLPITLNPDHDPDPANDGFLGRVFQNLHFIGGNAYYEVRNEDHTMLCNGALVLNNYGFDCSNFTTVKTDSPTYSNQTSPFHAEDTMRFGVTVKNLTGLKTYFELIDPNSQVVKHKHCESMDENDNRFEGDIILPGGTPGTWTINMYPAPYDIKDDKDWLSEQFDNDDCRKMRGDPPIICSTTFQFGTTQITETGIHSSENPLPTELCAKLEEPEKSDCTTCLEPPSNGVYTALGCIPIGNIGGLVVSVLGFAAGIGGGITFLLIVYGGFIMMTSAGNPEKVQEGREIITNAIVGLLLILFSAVILQTIGVDILKIPGFGGTP